MSPRTIAYFALGPVGSALLALVTLPLITWLFSQEDVGRFAMLQVALNFSALFFSLGLDQAYVREFHESSHRSRLFKLAFTPGFCLLVTALVAACAMGPLLSELLFGISKWSLSLLVVAALLAGYVTRFLSLILRMNERGLAFSMSQLLPKLLLLLIIGGYTLFEAPKSLASLALANTAAWVAVALVFAWNTRKEWRTALRETVSLDQLRPLLRFGLPLVPGGLAFWGLTATDKVFLRWLSNYEQLGLYSVAVSFAAAAAVLRSIFSTVWAPTVYKWASEGQGPEKAIEVMRYVLLCVVVLFSLAGLFSWLVPLFLPGGYQDVQWILVSCLGFPLLYTLSETTVIGIGLSRRSSFAMLAAVIAFGVNLVGNAYLVPLYEAAGAAVSTCFAFLVFLVLRTEFSIRLWWWLPRRALYGYTSLLVPGAICTTLWGEQLGVWSQVFWFLILCSVLFTFKPELIHLLRLLGANRDSGKTSRR